MRITTITMLLCLLASNSYSQYSYYKNALIIKSDSSKIYGYVEKISESNLSFGVKFKKSLDDSDNQRMAASEINEMMFLEDSSVYAKVPYRHKRGFNDTTKIIDYRLAKKILKGYAELYKLQLPEEELNIVFERGNTLVYIVKIDHNYYVLDQTERLIGTTYRLTKNYIGVLSFILKDEEHLKSELTNLKFTDKQIISLIDKLNMQHTEIPRVALLNKEKSIITHGPTISYALFNTNDGALGSGYGIGYSASIINPEVSERISVDFGISIGQLAYNYVDKDDYLENFIRVPITVTYHFNNSKFSPFICLGLTPYFPDPFILVKTAAGITMYKKYFFSFTAEGGPRLNSDRILFFSVGYVFGTKKK